MLTVEEESERKGSPDGRGHTRRPTEVAAFLAGLWRCPLLAATISSILGGWTVGDAEQDDSRAAKRILPVMVLLRLPGATETPLEALWNLARLVRVPPSRGLGVRIEATPLASHFFLNSWSRGVVGSLAGPHGCLVLTDARSATGCEGGPMFHDNESRELFGLIISSVSWCRGEWVGFTLGASLQPILQQLMANHVQSLSVKDGSSQVNSTIAFVDNSMLLIRCGAGWGSGVMVDVAAGTVLTCSHVVCKAPESPIRAYWKGKFFPASLVFRTRDGLAYDIAVIKIKGGSEISNVPFAVTPPVKGEAVIAVGFPLFSEHDSPVLLPTVTRGIISDVGEAWVQTTCCVQAGASGGAVLRPSGELLAILVCNIKDTDSEALYPHINLAVPSQVFAKPLMNFMQLHDAAVLQCLESPDPAVQRKWSLQLPQTNKL